MNKKIRETLDYYQDTEFDKTMKDIKDNLIARINRQEKEIEKWKWQKELLIKRDKEHQKEIERLKEELKYTIPIVEHNKTITKHLKEIERLNNIINEIKDMTLEKRKYYYEVLEQCDETMSDYTAGETTILEMYLNKLEDLGVFKGSE